jgi:ribonuclease HII
VNIYQATRLAMKLAVEALECAPDSVLPDFLLIDAMKIDVACAQKSIVYGDAVSVSIAAASVVAKVHRDALMRQMDEEFPGYGLALHKGYGTPMHKRALAEMGATRLHRRSYKPVAEAIRGCNMG